MKLKEQILQTMKDRKTFKLNDVYGVLPTINKPNIRATLNILVKESVLKRLTRGNYELVEVDEKQ